jgi:hypothetical protein
MSLRGRRGGVRELLYIVVSLVVRRFLVYITHVHVLYTMAFGSFGIQLCLFIIKTALERDYYKLHTTGSQLDNYWGKLQLLYTRRQHTNITEQLIIFRSSNYYVVVLDNNLAYKTTRAYGSGN